MIDSIDKKFYVFIELLKLNWIFFFILMIYGMERYYFLLDFVLVDLMVVYYMW